MSTCSEDVSSFDNLQEGCCRQTHMNPFTWDLHIVGVECKEALGWFVIVLIATDKVGQNLLYTKMGQWSAMLMQKNPKDRNLYWLIVYEAISGIIGIFSILVITGNNAFIWLWVILCNCGGVFWAYSRTPADHHSISLEILNMLGKHDNSPKDSNVRKVVKMLKKLLEETDIKDVDVPDEVVNIRKRLII